MDKNCIFVSKDKANNYNKILMKKKLLLSFLLLASFVVLNAQDFVTTEVTKKNVLMEEFTGRKCVNCPVGHIEAKAIEEAYPGRVWAINLHGGYYSSLDYPNLNTPICDTLGMYFNPNMFPSALINRQTSNTLSNIQWRAAVDEEIQKTADCNIAGQVAINPLTRVATVTVEVYYTATNQYDVNYLNVFMLQDSILGSQSGSGANPDQVIGDQYCHMHVLRSNVTPFWGDEITTTDEGSFITKTYEYQIPETIGNPNGVEVVLENLNFIAFVTERYQGAGTRPILNANKLHTLIATDESVLPYLTELRPKHATSCSKSKTFEMIVQNSGKEDITSMKFEISIDNRNPEEYEWNGVIPSNQVQIIEHDIKVPFGEHIVSVKLKEANGIKFDVEKSIPYTSYEWTDVIIEGEEEEFTIEVAQDKHGNQVSWEIKDSDHTVLVAGGPYKALLSGAGGIKVHTEKVVLSSGDCVKFTINDSNGDGINCGYGEGYYKIKDSKGNVVVDGDGKFGSQAVHALSIINEGDIVYEPDYVSTEVANRNVILEEFTGRNCPNCPDGHKISSSIVKDYPDRVWSMAIHSGYFTPKTYPNFQTDISATFMDPYDDVAGGLGLPAALINRTTEEGLARGQWRGQTEKVLSQVAECNVDGHVVINPLTRTASITTEVYYTGNSAESANYLTIVMLQDSIIGQQAYAETNPAQHMGGDMYCHMHVLRDVVTADWGDEIAPTTQGSFITKTYEYKIPEIIGDTNGIVVDLDNISFLAFVTEKYQGVPTRPILNANKLSQEQNTNVAVSPYISEVVMESGVFCTNERIFKTYVKNVGTKELTSIDFEILINGKNKTKRSWTGNLLPDATTCIDMEIELPIGDNEVAVNIVKANGTAFSYGRTVNAVCDEWATYKLPCVESAQLTIEIMQDKYGNHTTWEFMSSDNTVLASGGPYKYLPNADTELHTYKVTVEADDCFKLVIYDSYKNGINNGDGEGYYRILDEVGNVLVDGNGEFTDMTYSILSVEQGGSVGEMSASAYKVYPNPVKDVLTIKGANMSQVVIYNSLGQMVKSIEANDDIVDVNVENFQNGMYFINIIDDNGRHTARKVIVE